MKTIFAIAAAIALFTIPVKPGHADSPVPVVVELFTSEGCSDCPAADTLLSHLEKSQPYQGVQIIALEEHIDYWNNKKWRDPFSAKEFSDRQYHYADIFNDNSVYTPEMVINGSEHFVGSDEDQARSAIDLAAHGHLTPVSLSVSTIGGQYKLTITAQRPTNANNHPVSLLAAVTEENLRSHVADGENKGRTLTHSSVVRLLRNVGTLTLSEDQQQFSAALPATAGGTNPEHIVVFLQDQVSGKIYGANEAAI